MDSSESLFMRAISKQQPKSFSGTQKPKLSPIPSSSHVVAGSMAQEIHQENIEKLKGMSQEEIMAEKQYLESMLDPKTLAFIKSMKEAKEISKSKILDVCKRGSTEMEVDEAATSSTEMEVDVKSEAKPLSSKMETNVQDEVENNLPEPVVEIVEKAEKKGWMHMDDPEPNKVKWMQDLPENPSSDNPSEEPYNARFDFHGKLLRCRYFLTKKN